MFMMLIRPLFMDLCYADDFGCTFFAFLCSFGI